MSPPGALGELRAEMTALAALLGLSEWYAAYVATWGPPHPSWRESEDGDGE